jgi:hypothetical protein
MKNGQSRKSIYEDDVGCIIRRDCLSFTSTCVRTRFSVGCVLLIFLAFCVVFFDLLVFVMCLVYPMLQVFLDCPLSKKHSQSKGVVHRTTDNTMAKRKKTNTDLHYTTQKAKYSFNTARFWNNHHHIRSKSKENGFATDTYLDCSSFQLFVLSCYVSLRSSFRVMMSITIPAWTRCSVLLNLQLFIGGLMSYLRYLCLLAHSGVFVLCCWFVCLRLVFCVP